MSRGSVAVAELALAVDGVRSPLLQVGDPQATEAVVFLHGNPGRSDEWRDLLARTGEFTRAIAPDMPGFGDADKPRGFAYTVDGYAQHLHGLLEQLGVRRAHLVLHDFGGPWGLTWGAQHPDALASVTLINTGILLDYRWHRLARIWRTPLLGELFSAITVRSAFRKVVASDNPRLLPTQIDRLYEISRPWPVKRAVLKLYRASPPSALAELSEQYRPRNVPAQVVWGMTDAYIPWQQAERQRESFPSARIELLDGLGHWCFTEDPARVAEAVIPFLLEQAAEGSALGAPEVGDGAAARSES